MPLNHAIPGYVSKHAADIAKTPPGHRFLLYFQACGGGWSDLKEGKREALKSVTGKGSVDGRFVENLVRRQKDAAAMDSHLVVCAKTTSPIATGLGNPHPVENGFAFLSPYGIPYLAGSSVKGVIRKAAEELALFEPDSGWTIPLVWALFGFEEKSAYIDPVDTGEPKPLQDERERWRAVFKAWADSFASGNALFSAWLNVIRSQLPKDKQAMADNPMLFCKALALQDEQGRDLRRAIHWQGMLRFWDVFPETRNGLAVDILNPHHKKYYEGTSTPNDSESPVPVFFLTIPPGASCTFICEMPTVAEETRRRVLDAVGDWKALMIKAYGHAFNWLGFGAKTAVGYGAMTAGTGATNEGTGTKPSPGIGNTLGIIATVEEIWENARITWNPGSQTIMVSVPALKKKAEKKCMKPDDRAVVPQALHAKLFENKNKKPVNMRVTVEKTGNMYTIMKMEAP